REGEGRWVILYFECVNKRLQTNKKSAQKSAFYQNHRRVLTRRKPASRKLLVVLREEFNEVGSL
ncbi:MAG TPA: hypothetical protein DIS79_06040, partial [Bacteroidetes bacterium]|nr:hypothetical protein [Bacteroidota bacterium]